MIIMMMMLMMIKTQNSHNSANFEATTSRFFMVTELNDTYKMTMMVMMKIMKRMMKTKMAITRPISKLQLPVLPW